MIICWVLLSFPGSIFNGLWLYTAGKDRSPCGAASPIPVIKEAPVKSQIDEIFSPLVCGEVYTLERCGGSYRKFISLFSRRLGIQTQEKSYAGVAFLLAWNSLVLRQSGSQGAAGRDLWGPNRVCVNPHLNRQVSRRRNREIRRPCSGTP